MYRLTMAHDKSSLSVACIIFYVHLFSKLKWFSLGRVLK